MLTYLKLFLGKLRGHMMDIVVGEARLYWVDGSRKGWVVHGGYIISNRTDATKYARKVNELIRGTQ